MKKKIDFKFLALFNLTIIYFLKDFIFKVNYINLPSNKEEIIKIGSLIVIDVILNIIVIFFSKKELSAIKKFLIISIFIGAGYIFVSPLLHGIDEGAHFSRVYSFFMDSKTTSSGEYKTPRAILETAGIPEHGGNFSYIGKKIIDEDLVLADHLKGARLYTALSYLPFLLPVWLFGFLIKTDLFAIVTSARFFGFLVYLISSAYAIKIIPKRKDFLALFCLMPIVISSGATITADILTNSSIILFIAIWYKLYSEKTKITLKDIILIIISKKMQIF